MSRAEIVRFRTTAVRITKNGCDLIHKSFATLTALHSNDAGGGSMHTDDQSSAIAHETHQMERDMTRHVSPPVRGVIRRL